MVLVLLREFQLKGVEDMSGKVPIMTLALIFVAAIISNPANAQAVTDGLISYWSFDKADIEDDMAMDLWGDQHAYMQGAPKIVEGKVGNALEFDGASDWLLVSDDISTMKLPAREITLEAWIYPGHFIEWGGYLSCFQDNGSFEKGWTLGTYNQFSFAVSNETPDDGDGTLTYLTAGAFDIENWYHLVGVYDGEKMEIYVNGESKNTNTSHSGDISYPDHAFLTIGIYKDDNEHFPHKGRLDEVRLYEKALSKDEVLQNYNAEGLGVAVAPAGNLSTKWGSMKNSQ